MKRPFTMLAAALGTLAVLIGRAAADGEPSAFGRPFDASLDGNRSDWLFNVTTVSVSVLFIIMVGILLWTSIVHRDRADRHAHYEHGVGRKHLMFTAVISSIIFFGVDGTLLYNSFKDLHQAYYNFPAHESHPLEVEVMAQQWAWNIRYPGPDGKFGTADDIVTLNDLRVPKDTPVMLKLRSKDVIHSFYLPNFRIKQDAFPGSTTQMWFQATTDGQYEIGCAQHCGVSHYKMHGLMTVTDKKDFDAWLADAEKDAVRRYDDTDPTAQWGWDWEM